MSTPIETATEALWAEWPGGRIILGMATLHGASYAEAAAEEVLASLAQHRDDIATAIHARICEEALEEHLDPDWPGRCAKATDAVLAYLTGEAS